MRIDLQPAYVLHSREYRDTSLILEIFTPEHGRFSVVARGARRRRRGGTQRALLQPFIPLLVSFSGRGEMKNLVTCEAAAQAVASRGSRLFSALYVNELVVRLLHRHDPHPELFAVYSDTLANIARVDEIELVLRQFELTLLDALGYGFALDTDGETGDRLDARDRYIFEPGTGLVSLHRFGAATRSNSYPGSDLLAMSAGVLDGSVRETAKRLLREVLAAHLGPEPLRSRELFRPNAGRSVPPVTPTPPGSPWEEVQ